MHQELKNQVGHCWCLISVRAIFYALSNYAVVKTIKIKTNEIKTNIKINLEKELENFQVEEAVKHNSAKLDETLTKVLLLILISQFTKPNHANQS